MTKQEEIREGIQQLTGDYCSKIMSRDWFTPELTTAILNYLHSQGVVIKDRCCGVSHQGTWVKMYSVRSIIDGEVELFDGYGTKEEQ